MNPLLEQSSTGAEPVDVFAARARKWLAENMPLRQPRANASSVADEAAWVQSSRNAQKRLASAGFAGLMVPVEYGGQGLSRVHQEAFNKEAAEYDVPTLLAVSLGMIVPTLLEVGTESQKRRHIPAIIQGDELWVQLFSEPTGGSDLAGAITRADRDGDAWVLNGAKVWTTGAHFSDYGICLARTNWDVPKHRGLSVFIVPLRAAGVTIAPIVQLNGVADFCQEYFDDVVLESDSLVGNVNEGWNVARRVLVHERSATGGASLDGGLFGASRRDREAFDLLELVERLAEPQARQLAAESYVLHRVELQLRDRTVAGFRAGALPGSAGSVLKLFGATARLRRCEINVEVAGSRGVAWPKGANPLGEPGLTYLMARSIAIGGGTNEIQRNIVGEQVLGLPREPAVDHDIPFRNVVTNMSTVPSGP